MSFFDDFREGFNKGFEEQTKVSNTRQSNSTYRNVLQEKSDKYRTFDKCSDEELLKKVKSSHVSEYDKHFISSILRKRGYIKKGTSYSRYK